MPMPITEDDTKEILDRVRWYCRANIASPHRGPYVKPQRMAESPMFTHDSDRGAKGIVTQIALALDRAEFAEQWATHTYRIKDSELDVITYKEIRK